MSRTLPAVRWRTCRNVDDGLDMAGPWLRAAGWGGRRASRPAGGVHDPAAEAAVGGRMRTRGRGRGGTTAGATRSRRDAALACALPAGPGLRRCGRPRLGPGVRGGVPLQRRVAVHAGPRADHAAERGPGPDRPVMRACGRGGERADREQGDQPGRSPRVFPELPPRRGAGDTAVFASLQCLLFTGILSRGGLQPRLLPLPCLRHPQLHLPAGQVAPPRDLDDAGALRQLVKPERLPGFDRPGQRPSLPRGRSLRASCPCWFPLGRAGA